ncbi:MAG: acylneuraminate cytidylyltransferase family protein [Candidatus Omnitrophota bacterium]
MYKDKTILALIPARGGSKRLRGKNIRSLNGKPLIAWTVEEAMKSGYVDNVAVSTDDRKIAAVSRARGAAVPFLRPARLATDSASGMDVLLHAVDWFEKKGKRYDLILLLQPTSPLRTRADIDNAIRLLFSKKAGAIVSVYKSGHKPYWSDTLPKNRCMKDFMKGSGFKAGAPERYTLNGAIYLGYSDYIRRHRGFIGQKTFAYVMPEERSVDIDNEFDFWLAGRALKKHK